MTTTQPALGTTAALAPHALQRRALGQLHEHLGGGGRGVVVMPCGSGKTFLGRWFAEDLAARLTVVFVPTLALIGQTLMAYRSQTSWPHTSMVVCSDPTSGRAVAVEDLDVPRWARRAVTASTSPRLIGEFLRGPGPRVIMSTYHSAPRVAAALRATGRCADLVVCDEAHRLTGRPLGEFRAVLDDTAVPATRRVFLTATPVEAAAWEADHGDDEGSVLFLDEERTFGPALYRSSVADAVAEGLLVDYDVEVLAARDGQAGQVDPAQAVLAAAQAGSSRILTFHSRVSHARELARALDGAVLGDGRTVRAEHLESRHQAQRRARVLGELADCPADQVRVVASARVLTEGVDVPAVDTVVFAEPKTSAVDIVQAVGRAMRTAPGKTRGRIILTATLEQGDLDADTAMAATRWRHVWVVLRALADMDPRFAQTLRSCARHNRHGGGRGGRPGPGLRITLPDGVDLDRWLLRALDRTGASWWHNLELLRDWADEHGHARPSGQTRQRGVAIGSWVTRQRTMYRAGLLADEQITALEALAGWAWTDLDTAWWHGWAQWIAYHHSTGRARGTAARWAALCAHPAHDHRRGTPRQVFGDLAEFAVGTCALRRHGKLPRHLERAAEALPDWSWELVEPQDAAMVDALVEYAAWKGDFNPPHEFRDDDGRPLGAWVTAIRRRRYTGRLSEALRRELRLIVRQAPSAVGLRWEQADTGWRLGYLALRQFVAREGRCRVPYQHVEALPDHELNLSRWCVVARQDYRYGRMPAERVAALEQIPGWEWEISLRDGYRPALDEEEHGTRGAYARGCRCDPCTDANRSYEAERTVRVARGEAATDLVDARRARGHLRVLLGRGATQKALARASRLNVKTIIEVAAGAIARIRPETEEAVLALSMDAAAAAALPGRWASVPAGPTWELLDDMIGRGWPRAWISRELGGDGRSLQLRRDRVSAANAEAVAELDRRLGRRCPPPRAWRAPLPSLAEITAAEADEAREPA